MGMEDTQQQVDPAVAEQQALRAAQAGYNKQTRGTTPPVETPAAASTPADQPLADPLSSESHVPDESGLEADPVPDAALQPQQPDPVQVVSQHLAALRVQVQELKDQGGAAAEVRKLYGEIGNINRSLQQLQATQAAANAPAAEPDELAAALQQAEEVAKEFPEIAGPLVKAMKATQAKLAATQQPAPQPALQQPDPEPQQPQPSEAPVEVDAQAIALRARQEAAIEAINAVHPDRFQVNESPEFQAWFAAKSAEYQQEIRTTWNPAVLSKCYSDFKASRQARVRRQERLDAATLPQGSGASGGATVLPDEQGAWVGYNKKPRMI
jgi:hypothetical protein